MSELNKLVKALEKIVVSNTTKRPPRRSRRRKAGARMQPVPAGVTVQPNPLASRPRRARRSGRNGSGQVSFSSDVKVSRTEYLLPITGEIGSLDLHPSTFPFLKGISGHFARYKWTKLVIIYKPACGTMISGALTFGIDWSNSGKYTTKAQVTALTPVRDSAVWQSFSMALPSSHLQSRREYVLSSKDVNDSQPGRLWFYNSASAGSNVNVGDLWVTYSITLSGTTGE
nr:VP3 [Bayan-Khairhan-Ula Melophagus solemo-like virus]